MSIADEFELYRRELDLILLQNPIECELYSVIAAFLRNRENMKIYSLRDVSARRKSTIGNKFRTNAGFSDFAVMTIEEPKMVGAVEIKRLSVDLDLEKTQAEHHQHRENETVNPLVVLYTNGLEWRLYTGGFGEMTEKKISLGKIKKGKIVWKNRNWTKLIELLEEIDWSGDSY